MRTKAIVVVMALTFGMLGGWISTAVRSADASTPIPAGYVTLNGGRVYDSRGPSQTNPRLAAGATVTVATGVVGATAVGVNITLTSTVGPGFVAAWPSGPWPGTSIINSSEPGENIANFALIPVAPDGTFQLLTQQAAHLVVDVMGYMAGGSALVPAGFTATITGYGPGSTITTVSGTITNGTGTERDLRADVRCPNGTVVTDNVFNIPAGATRGFSVICSGVFASGATVVVVEI
jgi:hypothetical protein